MRNIIRKRDWSEMPDDVARLIMGKLLFSTHHCRFAAACRDWNRIAREFPCPYHRNSPFVLIPHNDVTEHGNCSIYQVSESKTSEFQLPELRDKYVHGSSNGWLMASNSDFELCLMNLLTQTQIELPEPSYALDYIEDNFEPDEMQHSSVRGSLIKKFAVSESPSSSTGGCVVAAIMSFYYKLFYCRPGDESWTCVQLKKYRLDFLSDVTFFGGKLYATGLTFIEVDFDDGTDFKVRTITQPNTEHAGTDSVLNLKTYLVECSGNLLYVCKFGEISDDGTHHKAHGFEIYKLDENDTATWSRVHELGEHSLFLGGNDSIAVLARRIPWCKANCIYFVDDVWGGEGFQGENGVFSLEDGKIEMYDISHSVACRVSPSMWYQQKR